MSENISSLTLNTRITDEINAIHFSPPKSEHICVGTIFVIIGLILIQIYTLGVIFIVFGLIYYCACFNSNLSIQFSEGLYSLKKGFPWQKEYRGSVSEFESIEVRAIRRNEHDFNWWVILRWKNGKEFTLGVEPFGGDAKRIAKELCSRLNIGFMDNSLKFDRLLI